MTMQYSKWLAATLVLGLTAATANAQSIDYSALEQLFGEPVTTSVNGSPQRASEVPATMEIITAEEIRRSGARDLPGVLRHVVGIDALQWGRDNTDLSIRGLNEALSPRVLVLIDGRQVFADFYGFTPWAALPVELAAIRQIEVVKGPNSALFGFNAVSGVINIITYQPLTDDTDVASVTAGTGNLAQASGTTTLRFGDSIGLRLSAGGRSNDDFDTPQSLLDLGSRQGNERRSAGARAGFRLSDNTELVLEGTYSESEQPNVVPIYMSIFEQFRSSSAEGVLSSDTSWGIVQARLYSNWFHTDTDFTSSAGQKFLYDSEITVAQLQDLFKLGAAHTIRVAGEYRKSTLATTPVRGGRITTEITALSTMWDWRITQNVDWSNAVRVDELRLARAGYLPPGYAFTNADWDRQFVETSANSGLVWRPTDSDTFRLIAGRGIQMPNLSALGGTLVSTPFGISGGTPFIDPATVTHFEAAWDRALPMLGMGGRLRVAAFTDLWRRIFLDSGSVISGTTELREPLDIGDSSAYGLELSLSGSTQRLDGSVWRWSVSYLPQVVDDDFLPEYVVEISLTDFENTTARHTVDARLGWSRGPWEADAYLEYKSGVRGIRALPGLTGNLVDVPGYVTVDARVGYAINHRITLAVSGQNLLKAEQTQTASADVERQVMATLSFDF